MLQLLAEQGVEVEGELVIRRIQSADGKSRASINDQPVSINLLRQVGGLLAEIHGQHDDRALVDVARHRDLLDAFGGLEEKAARVERPGRPGAMPLEALEGQQRPGEAGGNGARVSRTCGEGAARPLDLRAMRKKRLPRRAS